MPVAIPMVVRTAWSRSPRRGSGHLHAEAPTLTRRAVANRPCAANVVGPAPATYAGGLLPPCARAAGVPMVIPRRSDRCAAKNSRTQRNWGRTHGPAIGRDATE